MPWYINKVMPTIFANFAFVVISLLVAWHVTKNLRNPQTDNTETPPSANTPTSPTTIDFLRNYMFFEKIKRPNQVKPQTRTFFRYNNNQTFTLFQFRKKSN